MGSLDSSNRHSIQIRKIEGAVHVEPALYKRTLVPNVADLAFVGMNNLGAVPSVSEMQARYVAAVFNHDIPRPSEAAMEKDAELHRQTRLAGPHNKYDVAPEITEWLGHELGVTPSLASFQKRLYIAHWPNVSKLLSHE